MNNERFKELEGKTKKDTANIKTAKRCLMYKGFSCDNIDCLNETCPLHVRWRE